MASPLNTERKDLLALLGGKKALVLQTSGNPEAVYDAWDTKDAIKKVITTGGLEFFGIRDITYKVFFGVPIVSDDERQAMLEEAQVLAQSFLIEAAHWSNDSLRYERNPHRCVSPCHSPF